MYSTFFFFFIWDQRNGNLINHHLKSYTNCQELGQRHDLDYLQLNLNNSRRWAENERESKEINERSY